MSQRRAVSSITLLGIGMALIVGMAFAQDKRDPKSVSIAKSQIEALGGEQGWKNAHFIRYDFIVRQGPDTRVSRSHLWNKWTGDYRLEQNIEGGKKRVVLFNANTQKGDVYAGGSKLTGAEAEKALKDAYGAFINDMYWLSMPWKWLDPGVNLQYLGERTLKGEKFDVVRLTFGNVGLTPGDRYDAFVSRKTGWMTHWEYKLQSGRTGVWDWEYTLTGGVRIAKTHTGADDMEISMGDVRVLREVDPVFFHDPAKTLEMLK